MILLITNDGDPAAAAAENLLRARGVPFTRFEALRFPAGASVTQRFGARGSVARRLVIDDVAIDLAELTAVWHRQHRVIGSPRIRDLRLRKFAELEAEQALLQTWSDLPVRFLPAPLAVIRAGQETLRQLRLATGFGLEIPATLVTTDPDELLAFHREHGGRVRTKLLANTSMGDSGLGDEFVRFTESLSVRDLAARDSVRLCPVCAQADVPTELTLRITIVGARVFAAEVTRDESQGASPPALPYRRHALPRRIADRCVALTQALGLAYATLDLAVRPDGKHVFLALDPAGEYYWVEQRTRLPITAAIVDFLTRPIAMQRSA